MQLFKYKYIKKISSTFQISPQEVTMHDTLLTRHGIASKMSCGVLENFQHVSFVK